MSAVEEITLTAPVVVGVDGSASSLTAVELAAREAALRRRRLRIVHAFIWPYLHAPLEPVPSGLQKAGLRHDAERIVAQALARARSVAPEVPARGEVVTGATATVLLDQARGAELLVVGDRGLGGFTGLLVGSVAIQLASHVTCPVLVARDGVHPDQPVLLGVDGSPANDPAIGFAFETASLRGVPLVALHAWRYPQSSGRGDMLPLLFDLDELAADEGRLLAEALAGWQEKYPDVTVLRQVVRGGTRRVLIEATSGAQLVVVGTRGRGGFTGLLLGSVSQAVLHHAGCPVAIVPHPQRGG